MDWSKDKRGLSNGGRPGLQGAQRAWGRDCGDRGEFGLWIFSPQSAGRCGRQ